MKLRPRSTLLPLVLGLVACTHTPPGTSVQVALAKKAELVRLPGPPPGDLAGAMPVGGLPIIEPELPGTSAVERVGEAFSRGQFCMEAGKDAEAITAFQETVKIDPGFTEAWQHLAILYAKVGQEKKSLDAYHRAKKVAQH
jgi:Tetratricopeptide repeat